MSVRYWTPRFKFLCPECERLLMETETKWGEQAFYCPHCNKGWPIDHPALKPWSQDGSESSRQRIGKASRLHR